jgi:hypothetical protein
MHGAWIFRLDQAVEIKTCCVGSFPRRKDDLGAWQVMPDGFKTGPGIGAVHPGFVLNDGSLDNDGDVLI